MIKSYDRWALLDVKTGALENNGSSLYKSEAAAKGCLTRHKKFEKAWYENHEVIKIKVTFDDKQSGVNPHHHEFRVDDSVMVLDAESKLRGKIGRVAKTFCGPEDGTGTAFVYFEGGKLVGEYFDFGHLAPV